MKRGLRVICAVPLENICFPTVARVCFFVSQDVEEISSAVSGWGETR